MKLLFVTPCYYPNLDPIKRLRESASLLKIPLTIYGMGEGYSVMKAKIDGLVSTLKWNRDLYTHVLYTDGDDSFFTWNKESIMADYIFLGSPPCLISAELECAPVQNIAGLFLTPGPYRYICAGGFMGEIDYLIEKLQLIKATYIDNPEIECNDQAYWSLGLVEGHLDGTEVDSGCEVFQTMSGGAIKDLVWDQATKSYHNIITESSPAVLHFNGRTKGIELLYDKWKTSRGE